MQEIKSLLPEDRPLPFRSHFGKLKPGVLVNITLEGHGEIHPEFCH